MIPYGFLKVNENLNELLHEALKNGDNLTTPKDSQMLIYMDGISINSKPRRDGRYQGYIAQKDRTKKYFYGKTRDEVATKIKAFLQHEEETPKRKEYTKKTTTFSEYYNKWLELYKKPNLKPSSITNIVDTLKPALQQFADRQIDKITTDQVQELLLSIKAPNTRTKCKVNLNQIFTKAQKSGLIKINPCDNVEIKKHVDNHKNGLTPQQQNLFLTETANSKYSLLFRFLLSTGVRIGEALALTHADLDESNFTVSISKDVVFINKQRIIQPPKTKAANRIIPISQSLFKELQAVKTEIIFPYTYNAVRLAMQKISNKTSIEVTAHILRHTYSDRLEEAGIPPKVKQYLMGHAKLETTQNIYTEAQRHYVEASYNSLRKIFDT